MPTDTATDTEASAVTAVAPAPPADAARHFASLLAYETDCWDVHDALANGPIDFVLLDVRSTQAYTAGHVDGAVSLAHQGISDSTLARFGADARFVVYCAGPHCNGADRAALRLAELGRPVKKMIGGVTGWLDEGFTLVPGAPSEQAPSEQPPSEQPPSEQPPSEQGVQEMQP